MSGGAETSNFHRPFQIVHAIDQWAGTTDEAIRQKIRLLKAAGLGGLVTNVSWENYLRSEASWGVFLRGVRIAHEEGLRVWVYDEDGYPSGAAGGRVLEEYPSGEAQGLVRTDNQTEGVRYDTVPLYEGTHATENFYRKRHYINILDPKAVATFISLTHEHYARILEPIAQYVEAFFTDEPSLISAYIPKGKTYPLTLPWHPRLLDVFRERTGYDLLPNREHLFVDVDALDRKVRCDFYEMIADLCADTYFGQLQAWCQAHGVASSGHLLGEETMVWQTYFDGSPFPCYRKFDIPGIDMIISDPEKIIAKEYFLVPKIAGSAVRLEGKRRLMCEISDFLGQMDKHPASMEQMLCTAAILFSFGVTDLLSYYPLSFAPDAERKPTEFSPSDYRRYTDYVTRLHELFAGGTIDNSVAVLYPITSLWAHFKPSDRSMYEPHPDPVVRQIDEGFANICRTLLDSQIDYDVVDEHTLAHARLEEATLVLGDRRYRALVLPPADTVHTRTMEIIAAFVKQKGMVIASSLLPRYAAEGPSEDERVGDLLRTMREAGALGGSTPGSAPVEYLVRSRCVGGCTLDPASRNILATTISRAEGPAYFLVNRSSEEYSGFFMFCTEGEASLLDPATGRTERLSIERAGDGRSRVKLNLQPLASLCVTFSRGH